MTPFSPVPATAAVAGLDLERFWTRFVMCCFDSTAFIEDDRAAALRTMSATTKLTRFDFGTYI
jgi:hypothetical protein